jgi:cyclopropane fatty-acyl-phospholipid synthase-like methyltransferase
LHAVKKYGCRVTSLTISKAQHDLAVERIEAVRRAARS